VSPDQKTAEIEAAWAHHQQTFYGPSRAAWVKRERERLSKEQEGRCFFCEAETAPDHPDPKKRPTLEHLVPQSKGGTDDPSNLAMSCAGCNHSRDSRPKKAA
jgi:5-methylcytosine-specific restriction endonuclease McrA